jgi:hypothetical protein
LPPNKDLNIAVNQKIQFLGMIPANLLLDELNRLLAIYFSIEGYRPPCAVDDRGKHDYRGVALILESLLEAIEIITSIEVIMPLKEVKDDSDML